MYIIITINRFFPIFITIKFCHHVFEHPPPPPEDKAPTHHKFTGTLLPLLAMSSEYPFIKPILYFHSSWSNTFPLISTNSLSSAQSFPLFPSLWP